MRGVVLLSLIVCQQELLQCSHRLVSPETQEVLWSPRGEVPVFRRVGLA